MRIAFLTSRFPYPPLKGDKIRSYYPIKLLSRAHEIDLFSFNDDPVLPAHRKHMEQYCRRIETVELRKLATTVKMAAAVFTPWPSQVAYYRSRRMDDCLRNGVRATHYDLLHVVCGRLAFYANRVARLPRTIDWIDALSLSTQRSSRTERNPVLKLLYHLEYLKMKRFEVNSARQFDYSVITSQIDRAFLDNAIDEVLANGVDLETFAPTHVARDIDLVFTGNLAYEPNVVAVEFFCREILPIIHRQRPDVRFFAVGTSPSPRVLRFQDGTSIVVTGFVESMPEMLNRSRVFVAPLQSGAGIQNKVLEAMACGLPVVSTAFGNGGIQARDGNEILLADSARDFASCVLTLLSDTRRAETQGAAARELVRSQFSWEAKVERLDEIFRRIGSRPHASPLSPVVGQAVGR